MGMKGKTGMYIPASSVTNGKLDPQKAIKDKLFMKLYGKRDSGMVDSVGKSMTWNEYKDYKGPSFAGKDEYNSAVNTRESFSSNETGGNANGLLGNRKRVNIFGN